MDIYQILTEYNNPWSSREIFCFSCIMVIAVILMIYLLRKEKMNKLQAASDSGRTGLPWDCVWFYSIYKDGFGPAV